jgi:protein subunit release factor B
MQTKLKHKKRRCNPKRHAVAEGIVLNAKFTGPFGKTGHPAIEHIKHRCQKERSQIKNKAFALKVLKSRLFEKEMQKREAAQQVTYGEKQEIAWGSQIRSYVLHPYNMVKDHRTSCETSNATAVLDGKITDFLEAYLRSQGGK